MIWWLKDRLKRVVSVLAGVHLSTLGTLDGSDVGGRLSLRDSSGLGLGLAPSRVTQDLHLL